MDRKSDPMYDQNPFHMEWTGHMARREMEYRNDVPEGKVVEKFKEWNESFGWVPAEESLRRWNELMKALQELEEGRIERIRIAQEHYDARFGAMNPYVSEITSEDDEALQEIYAG